MRCSLGEYLIFTVRIKRNSVRCRGSRCHNEHFHFPLIVRAVMYILRRTNGSITAYESKNKTNRFAYTRVLLKTHIFFDVAVCHRVTEYECITNFPNVDNNSYNDKHHITEGLNYQE